MSDYNTPGPLCNEIDHVLLGYCAQCPRERRLDQTPAGGPEALDTDLEGYDESADEAGRLNAGWPPSAETRGGETRS